MEAPAWSRWVAQGAGVAQLMQRKREVQHLVGAVVFFKALP
jgi:hypothetical protein